MNAGGTSGVSFAASFPLPFRVLCLGGLGILCWATNLHGLSRLGIDVLSVLGIGSYESHHQHLPPPLTSSPGCRPISPAASLYIPIYKLFFLYSAWSVSGIVLFRYLVHGNVSLVDEYKYIPILSCLVILMIIVSPFRIAYKRERDIFLSALYRCMLSSPAEPIWFSDILLADILTSFAKVIGDLWLSVWQFMPGGTLLIIPSQSSWSRQVVPCLLSLPYLIRFRQCVVEYLQPQNASQRPLFNALKYASSFPVIFLSAIQRPKSEEMLHSDARRNDHPLFMLWMLAVAVNSLYSFWWDVTNDWGLELMKTKPANQSPRTLLPPKSLVLPALHGHGASSLLSEPSKQSVNRPQRRPWGLRPVLLYPLPIYPVVIFINLLLRLSWSIKLSPHLHRNADGAILIFWIEVAELLRRWMWVFFRVEWEQVRRTEDALTAVSFELHDGD